MIPSVEWVERYRLRQTRFQHLYKDFLKTKATELANKLIVDPIIEKMKEAGVSQKIWENVVVQYVIVNDDGILINIHNEYWTEDGSFDIALAREKGTEDHMIRPKNPDGLLVWIQNGKKRKSKGHMVSGLPRLNIIEDVVESNEYELQNKLNEEFRKWKSSIFSS